jgi:2-polyprenyl-3-methyl-5-hydroxy-6-metoxy-1,4-benzoquinol methylase
MDSSLQPAGQPEGNYYDKYHTRNPLARALMAGFLRAFDALLERCPAQASAIEAGCGEGELSIRMARRGMAVTAFDTSTSVIEEARLRAAQAGATVGFSTGSVMHMPPGTQADLVVCCEVLEHLDEPRAALQALAAASRGYLLVSVPREPLWRALNMARLRYLRQLGNTPGHVQHWSRRAFLRFLTSEVEVLEVRSPLPWTMALCRPR